MKKKHFNAVFLFCIITISLFIAGCGGKPAVVKETEAKPLSGKKGEEKIKFTKSDVAPQMKIFGTGNNFYGVVTSNEAWKSGGEPPHWLVLDSGGRKECYFEGMSFKGLFNISEINIYIKKSGEEYDNKIVLTNINLTNGFVEVKFGILKSTNLVEANRIKIEFKGTNVEVSNIMLYGVLGKEKDYSIAKEYKAKEGVKDILHRSSQLFKKKKYDEAIALNEEAIRRDPENPYPYMNLGQIWQEKAEKMESHGKYAEMMDRSLENYESAERVDNPERVILIERMIDIYWGNLIDPEKALRYEEELLKIKQANEKDFSEKDIARSYLSLAEKWGLEISMKYNEIEKSKREEAGRMIREYEDKGAEYILGNNPINSNNNGFAEPLYQIVLRYMGERRYERAIKLCKAMIEKLPDTEVVQEGFVHEEIALACMALGRWEEAIEAWKGYKNKSAFAGDNRYFHFVFPYCYIKLNDKENMVKWYVIAKRIEYWQIEEYKRDMIKIFKGNRIENNETKSDYEIRMEPIIRNYLTNRKLVNLDNEELIKREIIDKSYEYLKAYNIKMEK